MDSSNIGSKFLILLDQQFQKSYGLHKMFNCNNVKTSYSSMRNFGSRNNSHSNSIINNNIVKTSAPLGKCRLKDSCPLNCNSLQWSLTSVKQTDQALEKINIITSVWQKTRSRTDFISIEILSNKKANVKRLYRINSYGRLNAKISASPLHGIC